MFLSKFSLLYAFFDFLNFASVLFTCLVFSLLQVWNLKPGWGSRPDIHVEKGHSDDITALKFSSDGRILLSRSFDGSLKVAIDVSTTYCCLLPSTYMCACSKSQYVVTILTYS